MNRFSRPFWVVFALLFLFVYVTVYLVGRPRVPRAVKQIRPGRKC